MSLKLFSATASLILGLLITHSTPVMAKPAQCYTLETKKAEALVRLHSQLMVVTLSCRTDSKGAPLPAAYQQFTHQNLRQIQTAEKNLIQWHRQNGGASKLDKIRTEYGNEYSNELAQLSPQGFCDKHRDTVIPTAALSPPQLEEQLQKMAAEPNGKIGLCNP
jgi:hypothetical protein